jgi:NIPSNAP
MKQELPANQQDPDSKIACNPSTVCVHSRTSIPNCGQQPGVPRSLSRLDLGHRSTRVRALKLQHLTRRLERRSPHSRNGQQSMKTKHGAVLTRLANWQGWKFCATSVLSFACGAFIAHLIHVQEVKAESNRVFELMVYHTAPGKVSELESIFRDVSKLQAKHDLSVVGYWVPDESSPWKNTFVYLVAHPSRDDAKKNWDALHADPAFPPYRKAAAPLIEQVNGEYNVEEVFMRPTDFSAMK